MKCKTCHQEINAKMLKIKEEDPMVVLAKIKLCINKYYKCLTDGNDESILELEVVESIDKILEQIHIPPKYLIIEKLNMN